jgi:hypothetical protein
MKRVELYLKVRRAVMIDGMNRRGAATYFGNNRKTVHKMLVFPSGRGLAVPVGHSAGS